MDTELVIWTTDLLGEIDIPDSGLTWMNQDLYWSIFRIFQTYLEESGFNWRNLFSGFKKYLEDSQTYL